MNGKLNKINLISAIIIGGAIILIICIFGLQSIGYAKFLLILFPIGMITITIIIWFQIYITNKIKEETIKNIRYK